MSFITKLKVPPPLQMYNGFGYKGQRASWAAQMVVKSEQQNYVQRRGPKEEMVGSSDGHHRIAHFFMSYMMSRCPVSGVINALFYVVRFCLALCISSFRNPFLY